MKSLAAALLALIALADVALAQPAPVLVNRSLEITYNVFARGMNAGDFEYRFTQTGQSYEASATREMKGLIGATLNRSQDYTYSVRGAVATDGALRPAAYQHQGGRRREDRPNGRLVRASFSANDVTTTATPAMGMGDPPATAAQRRGVIDQVSAIAAMAFSAGDPCARTMAVYMDGRSRFDFVFTPNGRVNIDTRAYRGEALRCSVQFRPIAGFGDPQEAATLTFLFARTPSGIYAPVTIEMPTDGAGIVRLEARWIAINGAPLR
jgi:Protein of unknown function (DUF3108)